MLALENCLENRSMGAFAWPAAVLVIVIFALVFFRKEFSSLLNRTKEVGASGLKAYQRGFAELETDAHPEWPETRKAQ